MDKEDNSTSEQLPTWLTSEFLQTALRAGATNPNLTVSHYRIAPAAKKGDNFIGVMYRASVTSSTGVQYSLIIKSMPDDPEKIIYIRQESLFDTEIEMYGKTLPRIYEILYKSFPNFEPMTPTFLYSNSDGSVIVMEDLAVRGYKMAMRQKGLDLGHCEAVVKRLAQLHASSVVLQSKDPVSMDFYSKGLFKENNREYMDVYFRSGVKALVTEIQNWPDFKERYTKKLERLVDSWWEKITPANARDKDGFNVLNHGDVWVNNIQFSYSAAGEVEDVKFVDLQLVHYSSPAIDLIFFLYTSPTDDVRENHMDYLLKVYHDTLHSTLTTLNCPEKCPTLEQLQQDLKKRMGLALFVIICELPNMLAEKEDVIDIGDYFKETEEGPRSNKAYSNPEFKKVAQRLLPVFESIGLI